MPSPWTTDRIVANGMIAGLALLFAAVVLATSLPLHHSYALLAVAWALSVPVLGIGLWIDAAVRHRACASWTLPDPKEFWRRFRRVLWTMAVGLTVVTLLQPVFRPFPVEAALVLAAVLWGIFAAAYAILRKNVLGPRTHTPPWGRSFTTPWTDFRPRLETLAPARGYRLESLKLGERHDVDALSVILGQEEVAIVWRRRKGAVRARVRQGPESETLKALIADASLSGSPEA